LWKYAEKDAKEKAESGLDESVVFEDADLAESLEKDGL
jgi:hypothetical protein